MQSCLAQGELTLTPPLTQTRIPTLTLTLTLTPIPTLTPTLTPTPFATTPSPPTPHPPSPGGFGVTCFARPQPGQRTAAQATLCDPPCNPMCPALQPYVIRPATLTLTGQRTAAQATAESLAADEGGDDADGQGDMEIVEVHEGAAKAAGDAGGEAGAGAGAEAGAEAGEGGEAGEAGMASDRSDLLGMHLEEGGALVVLRARSLQVFARGPGGGSMGGTPPAAAAVGAAAPALPEASAPAHVESMAHRGLATAASRPQQRQGRPGAPPRSGPASAN